MHKRKDYFSSPVSIDYNDSFTARSPVEDNVGKVRVAKDLFLLPREAFVRPDKMCFQEIYRY